jgi:hypothetical protein
LKGRPSYAAAKEHRATNANLDDLDGEKKQIVAEQRTRKVDVPKLA